LRFAGRAPSFRRLTEYRRTRGNPGFAPGRDAFKRFGRCIWLAKAELRKGFALCRPFAAALHMPIPRKAARAGGINQQKVKAAPIFRCL
jgi:hypothetical protein